MSNYSYRKDIDGLRAIAVLSVILCHANSSWLPGGFVGVDIFFVISGFLITAIIAAEMNQDKFSFAQFYLRRIKRILPVFFLHIFVVLAVGSWLLVPKDFYYLFDSALYAVFFASNIYLAGGVDYFAPQALDAPLLHTWSLAVEEQYYFIWPMLLLILFRYLRSYVLVIAILLCVLSFYFANLLALDKEWAQWSFYQLPTRMGELLVGSILALCMPLRRHGFMRLNILALIGMGMIVSSFVLLDAQSVFPGYNALWPCLGTALLIYVGGFSESSSVIHRLLSSRLMVFFGKISYSLYLWHWPILAFARYYTMQPNLPLLWIFACFCLTGLLSVLSWKFVEMPIRAGQLTFTVAIRRHLLIPSIIIVIWATINNRYDKIIIQQFKDVLFTTVINHPVASVFYHRGCYTKLFDDCHIGNEDVKNGIKAVMFGDSHARHYAIVFDGIGKRSGVPIDFFSARACPFMFDKEFTNDLTCLAFTRHLEERLDNYDHIIIALRWRLYFRLTDKGDKNAGNHFNKNIESFISYWTSQGKNIYLVAQAPEYKFDVMRASSLGKIENPLLDEYRQGNAILEEYAARFSGVYYVNFDSILLRWSNGMIENKSTYLDEHHLNRYGQRVLLSEIMYADEYIWLFDRISTTQ